MAKGEIGHNNNNNNFIDPYSWEKLNQHEIKIKTKRVLAS